MRMTWCGAVNSARVGMAFDDEATSIESVISYTDKRVFDINGRKVANEFIPSRLPKGVYIVGGKKVVVK